ncbi:hypothetical protein DWX94_07495 [Coprococcus eutactus]|jgi:hypothetical protein|uniref:Uncharacterized protein n=1 Tax=Coprococcus eutactus TaxID=33043 RepID=A0A412IRU9_9FIRM|nr:hypothetical protein DWX94_07495 [Coprococcus eutactus]
MNKTTKAKYDMAEKMLKVNISLDEVALMTELPMETLKKIEKEIQKDGLVTRQDVKDVDLDSGYLI